MPTSVLPGEYAVINQASQLNVIFNVPLQGLVANYFQVGAALYQNVGHKEVGKSYGVLASFNCTDIILN